MITYEQFKEKNDKSKEILKNNPFAKALKIESVDLAKEKCVIQGKVYKIQNIVDCILSNGGCVTNPSALAQWKGFNINGTKEKVKVKYTAKTIENILNKNFSSYVNYGLVADDVVVVALNEHSLLGLFDLSTCVFKNLIDFNKKDFYTLIKVIGYKVLVALPKGNLMVYTVKDVDTIYLNKVYLHGTSDLENCNVLERISDRYALITYEKYIAIYDIDKDKIYENTNIRYNKILHRPSEAISSRGGFCLKLDKIKIKENVNNVEIKLHSTGLISDYSYYIANPMKKNYFVVFRLYEDDRPLEITIINDKGIKVDPYYAFDLNEKYEIKKRK